MRRVPLFARTAHGSLERIAIAKDHLLPNRRPRRAGRARITSAEAAHTLLASFLGWALDAFDFFILIFVHAGGGEGLPSPDPRHRVHDHRDARNAAGRRTDLRLVRRPLRPPRAADGRRHLLFDRRGAERPRADLRMVPVFPRAVRNRDGRRMGRRRVARDGSGAAAMARIASPACCKKAMRSAICWRRPRSSSFFRTTDGARCSFSAARPRC